MMRAIATSTSTPRRTRTSARMVGLVCMTVLTALSVSTSGCYRNVVGATGTGSDHYDIQEPNIEKGESFWSEPKPTEKVPNRYTGTTIQKNTRPAPQPAPPTPPPQ